VNIRLQFSLTAEDYVAVREAHRKQGWSLGRNAHKRRPWKITLAILTIYAFVLQVLVIYYDILRPVEEPVSLLEWAWIRFCDVAPFIAIGGALQLLVIWSRRSHYLIRQTFATDPKMADPQIAEISDVGMTMRVPGCVTEFEWHYCIRMLETTMLFLFWVSPQMAHVVPKRAFAGAAEMEAFRQFAMARVGNEMVGFPVEGTSGADSKVAGS
jgi:hypothetical protein